MVLKQFDLGPNQDLGANRTIDLSQPAQQAFAHAGAGFNGLQPGAKATYLGKSNAFDLAMASFAAAYADLNERDYESFVAAVRSGRFEAREGL